MQDSLQYPVRKNINFIYLISCLCSQPVLQLCFRQRPEVSGYFLIFPDSKISPCTGIVFKSNPPVHTHPTVSGFNLEKLDLHVVRPYWFIVRQENGQDLQCRRIKKYPDSVIFFISGERIQKYPDLLPNSLDACGRKPYLKRKSCRSKNIQAHVDGALSLEVSRALALVTCT